MPLFDLTNTVLRIVALIGGVMGLARIDTFRRVPRGWDRSGPTASAQGGLLQPSPMAALPQGRSDSIARRSGLLRPRRPSRLVRPCSRSPSFLFATAPGAGPGAGRREPAPGSESPVLQFERQQQEYREHFTFVLNPGIDIGVLYVFALGSLAVYGVILAGWSANSKYSLLGSLRASAQIISYEIPLGMAVLGVFLIVGSLNPEKIIAWQTCNGPVWMILIQPLALLLFMVSLYAEDNRLPFDLSEAEQELVGGYHTEYSSLKLGLMLLSEYIHLVVSSFMIAALFLGGWSLFGLESIFGHPVSDAVVKLLIICTKMPCSACSHNSCVGRFRDSASTSDEPRMEGDAAAGCS